jgi:hypothetical protein
MNVLLGCTMGLQVAAGGSSHLEEAYRVIGDHGLLTDQVQHRYTQSHL